METFAKIGEFDGVLDEDGVMLRTSDERLVSSQEKRVIFHRAPGLYFKDRDLAILVRLVGGNTAPCLRSMTCLVKSVLVSDLLGVI